MMSNDNGNDFVVDTRGYCFLCLSQTKLISIPECDQNKQPVSVQSIQYLSKYLKLDMSKVFQGPVPPDLLAKVERSRLKVELCCECSSLNDKLSELLCLVEKIKLDIAFRLSDISDVLQSSNKTDRFHEIKTNIKTANSVSDVNIEKVIRKLEIAQVLREEAGLKCAKKLRGFPYPKIPLEKMNINEIKNTTQTNNNLKTEENVKIDDIYMKMKTEIPFSPSSNELDDEVAGDTDNFDDSLYLDNKMENISREFSSPETTNSTLCGTLKKRMKILRMEKRVTNNLDTVPPPIEFVSGRIEKRGSISSKSRINPESGKHQCQICSKEYSAIPSFHMHFKTAHMNVSYTCKAPDCGKSFGMKFNYEKHYKSLHLGIRYRCKICKTSFSQKQYLVSHVKKAHS